MRKAAHGGFNKNVVKKYHNTQTTEAILLVHGIATDPVSWDQHLRRAAASVIMSVVYGTPPIESNGDPSIANINELVAQVTTAAHPGAHLVEFFPWMIHIPKRCTRLCVSCMQ